MAEQRDEPGLTYAQAGVDITAGNQAVDLIKAKVKRTWRPEVLTDIGSFAGFFALDPRRYQAPVLVAGTDGVGTKLRVAMLADRHDTIGIDCVAMCVNDILVQGAEPLFFLDYLAVGKLNPEKVAAIVGGVAAGCEQAGCALIGGETAEMPGFYGEDEYDLAGFAVGIVERSQIVDGTGIRPGDCVLGLRSSGLHSNGYSLARKVLLEQAGYTVDTFLPDLGRTVGEEMLEPTRIYVKLVSALKQVVTIKGMAHITGGGLTENVPRILPAGVNVVLAAGSWPLPGVFSLIKTAGRVAAPEMLRTFNCGIGMVVVIAPEEKARALDCLAALGEKCFEIGVIQSAAGTAATPRVVYQGEIPWV